MVNLKWWKTANNDLIQIYDYICEDSIYYAIKTVNEITELVENIKIFPYMGRKVPEINEEDIREIICKSYRIIYKINSNEVLIRRIWHSARKLPKQLIS